MKLRYAVAGMVLSLLLAALIVAIHLGLLRSGNWTPSELRPSQNDEWRHPLAFREALLRATPSRGSVLSVVKMED
jgi:hypothetical protein